MFIIKLEFGHCRDGLAGARLKRMYILLIFTRFCVALNRRKTICIIIFENKLSTFLKLLSPREYFLFYLTFTFEMTKLLKRQKNFFYLHLNMQSNNSTWITLYPTWIFWYHNIYYLKLFYLWKYFKDKNIEFKLTII